MNYLSHLFLAENSEESLIGNLLGDFVKGKLTDIYPPGIIKGIKTHRKVDFYTDNHPLVKEARKLISSERSKYSGVLIDIFFDHFLSNSWSRYSDIGYENFIDRVYKILPKYTDLYPEKGKILIPRIVEKDWLRKYKTVDGLGLVFDRLSIRVKRENPLLGSESELTDNYQEIEEKFHKFFPEVIEFVEKVNEEL